MSITAADFYILESQPGFLGLPSTYVDVIDSVRLKALIEAPDTTHSDLDVTLALMDLIRDDLLRSGTDANQKIGDANLRLAVRALERTSTRAGRPFKLPFRDHADWKSYWINKGARGSWQARRNLLSGLFDEPYAALSALQDRSLEATLLEPASPHERLGWPAVDTEVGELRRHFRTASTPQDYRAVGNDCAHAVEELSRQVYDHARHTPSGEEEPPVAQTKLRLDRFVEERLPGKENVEMRKYARATIELAQAVKHRTNPSRTDAGIAADAVISLANLLRRLDEPSA